MSLKKDSNLRIYSVMESKKDYKTKITEDTIRYAQCTKTYLDTLMRLVLGIIGISHAPLITSKQLPRFQNPLDFCIAGNLGFANTNTWLS